MHASKIERTFAEKAGAAFDLMAQDGACRRAGTGQSRLGRAKDRDERNPKTVGEVHCSCVVGEEDAQRSKPLDQFIERSLAGEVFRAFPSNPCRISAARLRSFSVPTITQEQATSFETSSMVFRNRSTGQRLAGPYFGARADTKDDDRFGVIARCTADGGGSAAPQRSGNVKVSISLVFRPRRLLFLGLVDYLSQQHRSEMPAKSHPARNPGKPRLGRAAKRIREEDRGLEASAQSAWRWKIPTPPVQRRSPHRPRQSIFQKAASFAGVRTASRASGRPSLNARAARRLMTASPSQLGERMTKRNGCSFSGSVPGGR